MTPKDWLEFEYFLRLQIARIISPVKQTVHASWDPRNFKYVIDDDAFSFEIDD